MMISFFVRIIRRVRKLKRYRNLFPDKIISILPPMLGSIIVLLQSDEKKFYLNEDGSICGKYKVYVHTYRVSVAFAKLLVGDFPPTWDVFRLDSTVSCPSGQSISLFLIVSKNTACSLLFFFSSF